MTLEASVNGFVYAVCACAVLAGAFWYGWELRTRLALKLEYFRVSNRRWVEYDAELANSRSKVLARAEIRDIRESER